LPKLRIRRRCPQRRPIGAPPYASSSGAKACILICDITRPVPNHLFLRLLIEGLLAAGMARERITVLVAPGCTARTRRGTD
jgi:nickel-dependent lactate racemase